MFVYHRDLLRETDRLYERQRELDDIRKDKARHAARVRAEAADLGLNQSDYDGSSSGDDETESERSEIVLSPRDDGAAASRSPRAGSSSAAGIEGDIPDTPRLTRSGGMTPRRSASRRMRPKSPKVEYKGLFQVPNKKKW